MAYDAFMWLDGGTVTPKGETTDKTYSAKGAFEIYSFSWGVSNPVTIGSATGGVGGGKASLSSFNVMKKTDAASPVLMNGCCIGDHFTGAHVVLRKAGGKQLEYLKLDFEEVFVESVQWSGSSGGDDTPTESASFAFGKVSVEYTPQVAGGTGGTMVPFQYDIRQNITK